MIPFIYSMQGFYSPAHCAQMHYASGAFQSWAPTHLTRNGCNAPCTWENYPVCSDCLLWGRLIEWFFSISDVWDPDTPWAWDDCKSSHKIELSDTMWKICYLFLYQVVMGVIIFSWFDFLRTFPFDTRFAH